MAALAFAAMIHFTSPVHFFVAVTVLLLAWPASGWVMDADVVRVHGYYKSSILVDKQYFFW